MCEGTGVFRISLLSGKIPMDPTFSHPGSELSPSLIPDPYHSAFFTSGSGIRDGSQKGTRILYIAPYKQ
jgi:hypothetical protein